MPSRLRIVVLFLFALSGAAGLMHEIAWTRVLRHVLGGSSLALTSVLVAFLGGLGLGAWWVARRIDRLRRPLRLFAWLEGQSTNSVVFNFELIYFNSSSAKVILGIFDALEECAERGVDVVQNRCPKIEYQRLFGELRMGGFATGVISSKL